MQLEGLGEEWSLGPQSSSQIDAPALLPLFFFLLFLFLLGRGFSNKPKAPLFQIVSGWNFAGIFF